MSVARQSPGLLATVLKAFSCSKLAGVHPALAAARWAEHPSAPDKTWRQLQGAGQLTSHGVLQPGSEWELTEVGGRRGSRDY